MGPVAAYGVRHRGLRKLVRDETDERLVARVRAGDDGAFEAIYDRYARGVFAFCAHMLGTRESAEDALQMTFAAAYRAIRSGSQSIALRPWLYTIARNRCLSDLRARHGLGDLEELAIDRLMPDDVADQVHRREELRETLEDVHRLPSDQRAALVLLELGDHSYKEIATVLDVRSEKVKALVFQAREGLARGRRARAYPCTEIREQLATLQGKVPSRSITRAHIDRCRSCAAFEVDILRQRAALALIIPVVLSGELKSAVLGSVLGGGGAAAAGVTGGGSAALAGGGSAALTSGGSAALTSGGSAALTSGGSAALAGGSAGTLVAGGTGAAGSVAVVGAAGSAAVLGVGSLAGSGLAAKVLTVAAIASGAASVSTLGGNVHAPPAPRGASTHAPSTPPEAAPPPQIGSAHGVTIPSSGSSSEGPVHAPWVGSGNAGATGSSTTAPAAPGLGDSGTTAPNQAMSAATSTAGSATSTPVGTTTGGTGRATSTTQSGGADASAPTTSGTSSTPPTVNASESSPPTGSGPSDGAQTTSDASSTITAPTGSGSSPPPTTPEQGTAASTSTSDATAAPVSPAVSTSSTDGTATSQSDTSQPGSPAGEHGTSSHSKARGHNG